MNIFLKDSIQKRLGFGSFEQKLQAMVSFDKSFSGPYDSNEFLVKAAYEPLTKAFTKNTQ